MFHFYLHFCWLNPPNSQFFVVKSLSTKWRFMKLRRNLSRTCCCKSAHGRMRTKPSIVRALRGPIWMDRSDQWPNGLIRWSIWIHDEFLTTWEVSGKFLEILGDTKKNWLVDVGYVGFGKCDCSFWLRWSHQLPVLRGLNPSDCGQQAESFGA